MRGQTYILSVDQSTSGTKALLFDDTAALVARCDMPHRQIINEQGWVEHDGEEIYQNTISVVRRLIKESKIDPAQIKAVGISNQRETGMMWTADGKPVYNAVVWQCARGAELCHDLEQKGYAKAIGEKTGLRLSPYFTAAKFGWLIKNVPAAQQALAQNRLCAGTIDAWLIYRLTGRHCTDYSNASRTQLFNIHTLEWDDTLCQWFGVPKQILPQVCDSDSLFGETTFEGALPYPVPVCGVLGDSHAALFAQQCTKAGMGKGTYGTGSSVMINTGAQPLASETLVTSLAWRLGGQTNYVLEGNINYTGAVIGWLKDNLNLIESAKEVQPLAESIPDNGGVYLVPALSGLGAPYWNSEARAILCGMSRTTTKAHIARAAEECIAYQITDIIKQAQQAGVVLQQLRADGGPTRDCFLMQFQCEQLQLPVLVSATEELSGAGAAYVAGLAAGVYTPGLLEQAYYAQQYLPQQSAQAAGALYNGWQKAVAITLKQTEM